MVGPRERGFTLTEMAVVFVIVGFLLASALYTLSAQMEQRNFDETRRRIEAAKELILAFAIVNGRLPCPGTTTGDEAFTGATCTNAYGGFLPGRAIGFQIVDANGFALDAWQNRIRYAVSVATPTVCTSPLVPHFVSTANLKANGITCKPSDLVVCRESPGTITSTICDPGENVTNQDTVVAIVFSTGRNGATGGTGLNEARNLDNNQLFVSRTPDPATAAGGEFDDQMAWIAVGELYGRLIAAGVLP